jgi:hypothetical protein
MSCYTPLGGESEIHLFKSDALAEYHGRATDTVVEKVQESMSTLLVGDTFSLTCIRK